MTELTRLSAAELAARIHSREVSAVEVDLTTKQPAPAPVAISSLPPVNAPERGFMVMLPLNVALKVESLAQPPVPAEAPPAVPTPAMAGGGKLKATASGMAASFLFKAALMAA